MNSKFECFTKTELGGIYVYEENCCPVYVGYMLEANNESRIGWKQ